MLSDVVPTLIVGYILRKSGREMMLTALPPVNDLDVSPSSSRGPELIMTC